MRMRNIPMMAAVTLLLWMMASVLDVNANNMGSREYAPWNAFALAAGGERAAQEGWNREGEPEGRSRRGKVPEETARPDRLHTEENIMLLARLIEAENGSAVHDETLHLTGVCVLKRVKDPSYPDTLEGVIFQEWNGGRAYATAPGLEGVEPSERALEIAEELLVYGVDEYPDSLVFQAMFPQGKRVYKRLDGEYFCLAE